MTAACVNDVATLLLSPMYATVRPSVFPQRSRMVITSASAWQGCSLSVSAFTTLRFLPAVARRWAFS